MRVGRLRVAAVAAALMTTALVGSGAAEDGPFGPLAPLLTEGTGDVWTMTMADGTFSLENTVSPANFEVFSVPLEGRGARTIRIEVELSGGNPSTYIGLVFGSDPAMDRYYFLAIGVERNVTLFAKDMEGTSPLVSTGNDTAVEGINTITIRADDGVIEMFLNGNFLGGINEPAPVEAGFGAWGMGKFTLHGYEVIEGIVDP